MVAHNQHISNLFHISSYLISGQFSDNPRPAGGEGGTAPLSVS